MVTGVKNNQAFVTDGTKGFIIYASNHGFAVGNVLSGTAACKVQLYNGAAEITTLTKDTPGLIVTTGGTVTSQVVAITDLSGVNTGALIQVNGVTYNGTYLVDGNSNQIKPYNTLYSSMSFTNNQKYNVTGVYLQFNTTSNNTTTETKEILPRSSADIVEVNDPTISASPASLTGFTYVESHGPSTTQTVSVSGSNLTANISLSLGDDSKFEMCQTQDGTYTNSLTLNQSNGSVSATNVYVRLKSGLSKANNYAGTITLTSTDATNKTVSLSGSVTGQTYAIEQYSLPATAHGTISFSPESPIEDGTEVTLTAEPAEGYDFTANSWVFYKESGNEIVEDNSITVTNGKITMPAYDLWVDGTFTAKTTYAITTIINPANSGTVVTDESAWAGKTVSIEVEAAANYSFSSIAVTKTNDSSTEITTSGNVTDGFTFEMPSYPVTVTATFVAILDITFNVNGTQKTVKHINQGSQIGELPVLADSEIPSGLAFKGWTSSTDYFDATTPAATITEETVPASSTTYAALFCVSTPGVSHWTLTSDAPAAGDDVILAVLDGTTYYALFATTGALTRTSFSVSNNTITGDIPSSWEVVNASYTSSNVTYTGLGLFSGSYQTVQNEDKELYLHINSSAGKIATTFQNGVFDFDASGSGYTLTSKVNSRYLKYESNAFGVSSSSNDLCTLYVFKKVTEPGSESNYTTIVTDKNISGEVTDLRIFKSISATADVTNNGTIHIFDGGVLDMGTNILTNATADNLIIEDGGQLITSSAGVQATFKKTIETATPSAAKDVVTGNWYTISSPTGGIAITDVTNLVDNEGHTLQYNLYRLSTVSNVWEAYNTDVHQDFTTLEKGRGYLYRNNGKELSFAGEVNVGQVVTYELTKTYNKGFNLIGNPYGHTIYKGVGGAIDTDALNTGFYYLTNHNTWQAGTFNNPIGSRMGILVQANTPGTITINDYTAGATAESNAVTSKSGNDEIMFQIANNQYEDVAYAMFSEGRGLSKIDHRNPEAPMLYINQSGENYAIAMMSDDATSFNLNFKAMTMGKYTLKYKAKGQYSYLHVIDRLTGNDVDMLLEGEYSFIGSPSDADNRFIVKLNYEGGSASEGDIFAYQSGDDIVVSGEGELQVFDLMGRMVMTQRVNGVQNISVKAQGVYVFKLNGMTQKIVVK